MGVHFQKLKELAMENSTDERSRVYRILMMLVYISED